MCLNVRDLEEIITQVFEEMHDEKKPSKEYVFSTAGTYHYT